MRINSNSTLHFFCGKPGAGKTTLASQLAKEHNALRISEDVCMVRLFGDQLETFDDYIRLSRRLKEVVGPIAKDVLIAGQSVILDFQANTKTSRNWFRSVFEEAAAEHVLHYLKTSNETCLSQIAKRNAERPEGAHFLTEEDFIQISSYFQEPETSEGFNVSIHAASAK